ncbi:unnamed protein product [Allacma fusca]|uniref:Uncharacterized protein n=1 Tax=Allacma fusca TaxID=39272 RepID=A0A8J2K3J5_9HEXA|nr:unnamed protein product [Allacma fusca]
MLLEDFTEMILQRSWLLVFALYQAWVVPGVDGKGRALNEQCFNFDDCGDYPRSALLCLNNICQCINSMYYEQSKSMCVSYIGEKCDAVEPTDAIKLELQCGENSFCQPSLEEKFGRCRCSSGYRSTSERKCASMSNSRVHGNFNANHPNHPKYGEEGNKDNSQNPNSMNGVVSFPFSSANSNPRTSNPKKDSLNYKFIAVRDWTLEGNKNRGLLQWNLFIHSDCEDCLAYKKDTFLSSVPPVLKMLTKTRVSISMEALRVIIVLATRSLNLMKIGTAVQGTK